MLIDKKSKSSNQSWYVNVNFRDCVFKYQKNSIVTSKIYYYIIFIILWILKNLLYEINKN